MGIIPYVDHVERDKTIDGLEKTLQESLGKIIERHQIKPVQKTNSIKEVSFEEAIKELIELEKQGIVPKD